MQRNQTLIREILKYVEGHEGSHMLAAPKLDGYSDEQIHYHIGLCVEAGYLEAQPLNTLGASYTMYPRINHMTWHGHEALDSMRAPHQMVSGPEYEKRPSRWPNDPRRWR